MTLLGWGRGRVTCLFLPVFLACQYSVHLLYHHKCPDLDRIKVLNFILRAAYLQTPSKSKIQYSHQKQTILRYAVDC